MKNKLRAFGAWFVSLWRNYYFVMGVGLVVAAVVLTFFLEYRYFIDDFGRTWEFFTERPLVFWYNALLVLLMLFFLTGITRRPALSVGVLLSVFIALSYVHVTKFQARGYPLLPEDLLLATEAESMSQMVDVGGVVSTIIAIVITLGLSIVASITIGKAYGLKKKWSAEDTMIKKYAVVSRLVLIVTSMAVFLVATDFVRNNSGQKYEPVPWLDSELVAWNQVRNYDNNGFILGFLYNLQKLEISEPEEYTKDTVQSIRGKYEAIAKTENELRENLADDEIHFVIVLNESFIDPDERTQYYPYAGGEVTPNLHKIQLSHPSGEMYSLDYGGGTANIEYEILTGLSNYWSNTVPYTALIPKTGKVPSTASYFGGLGYETTGIHPFNGSMYKRDIAFKSFGIDSFITEREMAETETEGNSGYINDRSAYDETLSVLEGEGNQFTMLVTMQNHLPYANWIYGDDAEMPFQVEGEWPDDDARRDELAVYYKLLNVSDEYLGDFISALDQSEHKTVVLFFGDHSAGLYPEIHNNEEQDKRDTAQETPYFIYTNYDSGLSAEKLPTTTPNCLVNTTLNLLGSQKPALYYLLDRVCAETPILSHTYLGENGYTDSVAMKEYELVSYDLVGGQKYWGN